MPIDPYAALNAMLRAEVTRCTPPAPKPPSRGSESEDTSATGSESSPED